MRRGGARGLSPGNWRGGRLAPAISGCMRAHALEQARVRELVVWVMTLRGIFCVPPAAALKPPAPLPTRAPPGKAGLGEQTAVSHRAASCARSLGSARDAQTRNGSLLAAWCSSPRPPPSLQDVPAPPENDAVLCRRRGCRRRPGLVRLHLRYLPA